MTNRLRYDVHSNIFIREYFYSFNLFPSYLNFPLNGEVKKKKRKILKRTHNVDFVLTC